MGLADCLRANKSTMAWGLEARVPFLDRDFLDLCMNIDPAEKMIDQKAGKVEKYILRKAFDTSDEMFANPKPHWGNDIPTTKEAYWYRLKFDALYPQATVASTVMRWIPKADWGCAEDPSGR